MYRTFSLLVLVVVVQLGIAQEVLLPIEHLPSRDRTNTIKKGTPIGLPFFDDFSYVSENPDPTKWEDNYVFINDGFAKNTVTVGVATFDCLNSLGALHDHLGYFNSFPSDTLTSKAIDLSSSPGSIFLSFLYQGGGNGPIPSEKDKLVLQFYSKGDDKWIPVWESLGMAHENFQEAYIAVNDAQFLTDSFRFRFINFVTLGKDDKPNQRGNSDVWNIDYVYLDYGRTDGVTNLEDIQFTKKSNSFIKDYQSVPWIHFLNNPSELMTDKFSVSIKNQGLAAKNINALNFIFKDIWSDSKADVVGAGSYDLTPGEFFERTFPNTTYYFNSSSTDSALFEVKTEMLLDKTDFWKENNSTTYKQVFKDYYAYDDGGAEAGYGLIGNGSSSAQVAYRFDSYLENDKMWGVDIFFTRTLNAENLKYFYLMVWEDKGGEPGKVLYRQPLAENLKYIDQYGAFNTLRFHGLNDDSKDTSIVAPKSFFIGWEQTVEGHLGIGLDKNNIANKNLFYNVSDSWQQSSFEGALMMRPVFRKRERNVTSTFKVQSLSIKAYPNPAKDIVTVVIPENERKVRLNFYDIHGKLCKTHIIDQNQHRINISELPKGIYLLKGVSDTKTLYTGRLIVDF